MTKQQTRLSPVPTTLKKINKLYVGPIIESDARPTGVPENLPELIIYQQILLKLVGDHNWCPNRDLLQDQ